MKSQPGSVRRVDQLSQRSMPKKSVLLEKARRSSTFWSEIFARLLKNSDKNQKMSRSSLLMPSKDTPLVISQLSENSTKRKSSVKHVPISLDSRPSLRRPELLRLWISIKMLLNTFSEDRRALLFFSGTKPSTLNRNKLWLMLLKKSENQVWLLLIPKLKRKLDKDWLNTSVSRLTNSPRLWLLILLPVKISLNSP